MAKPNWVNIKKATKISEGTFQQHIKYKEHTV